MQGSVGKTCRLVGWTALCLVAAASIGTTPAEEAADQRLRDQVTARLEGQVALHPRDLRVEVDGGLVRLSGTVSSLEEVDTVDRLVQGIVGVRRLENNMQVRPSTRSDLAIAQEIRRRLDRYIALRSPAVEAAVSEGRAVLTGQVGEAVDRTEAERQARSVSGAVSVDNQVVVEGPVWGSRQTGPGMDGLAGRVRSLLANPLTFGAVRELRVEAHDGTIHLHGAVARQADKEEAERLARSVGGVEEVVNLIVVDPT